MRQLRTISLLSIAASFIHRSCQTFVLIRRSLSRKLKEEGTNYRNISNHIMEVRACGFLDNTRLSVDAIAAQMGFQDAANFRRAFKSWQGCSPGDYRIRSSTFES